MRVTWMEKKLFFHLFRKLFMKETFSECLKTTAREREIKL